MTARALVLAAASVDTSTLRRPLRARDTELMAAGLRNLGAQVSTDDEELWVIRPCPPRGSASIDVGLAGTVMRFLPAYAALADGDVTFDGDPRARQRPIKPLVDALRALGVSVSGDNLPLTVHGAGRVAGGDVTIDASQSSQLVSGLLLAAAGFDAGIVLSHVGSPVPSTPHLRMTTAMLRAAGAAVDDSVPNVWRVEPGKLSGRAWNIEPDLSNAAPFLASALLTGGEVTVRDWPRSTTQPGDQLRLILGAMGGSWTLDTDGLTFRGNGELHGIDADLSQVGELTPVIAALCALAEGPSTLRGIGHIRTHETDRLAALARELTKIGSKVTEHEDGLTIIPGRPTAATIETYDDHRLAHAAAVIGLRVPGIELTDISCTSKTMPEFATLWAHLLEGQTP